MQHERQSDQALDVRVKAVTDAAYQIRMGVLEEGEAQGEGYVGQGLGAADILAAVYQDQLRFRPQEEKVEICAAVEREIWPMLADGRIKLSPETRIPFDEVRRAHEQLAGGDNVGKIVLVH